MSKVVVMGKLSAYIEGLPDGLESYGECQCRGGVVHALLDSHTPEQIVRAAQTHEVVAGLIDPRPLTLAWVPEAHCVALALALTSDLDRDDLILDNARAVNKVIFSRPAYRALGTFFRPERLLRQSTSVWSFFHRGTQLTWAPSEVSNQMLGELVYPKNLIHREYALAISSSFEAISDLGAAKATCTVLEVGPTKAKVAMNWAPRG